MGLSTEEIMQISLDLVGWDDVPADSGIHVRADAVENALVGIDLESPEIALANRENYDLVLAHHPPGGDSRVNFAPVLDTQVAFMTAHGVPRSARRRPSPRCARAWTTPATARTTATTPASPSISTNRT